MILPSTMVILRRVHLAQRLQIASLALGRLLVIAHPAQHRRRVVADFNQINLRIKHVVAKQGVQIQPLERGFSEQPVVQVVAIDVDNSAQKFTSRNDKAARGRPVAPRALGQTKRSKGESCDDHTPNLGLRTGCRTGLRTGLVLSNEV